MRPDNVLLVLVLASLAGSIADLSVDRGLEQRKVGRANTIRPVDESASDAFVRCASAVLGRPLLIATGLTGNRASWLRRPPRCPRTVADLQTSVTSLGLKLVATGEWYFAYPAVWHDEYSPGFPVARWTVPHVGLAVNDSARPGGRRLAPSELAALGRLVTRAARPPLVHDVPLRPRGGPSPVDADDVVPLELRVDTVKLSPRRTESVVVTYGQNAGLSRLVVGTVEASGPRLQWDSPLFQFNDLEYRDLDADGVDEILLWGRFSQGWRLVAFSADDSEITRQSPCEAWTGEMQNDPLDDRPYVDGGFTCPIQGPAEVEPQFSQRPDGRLDIVASRWRASAGSTRLESTVRYTLEKGRYVARAR